MSRVTGSTFIDILLFVYGVIAPGIGIAAVALRTDDPLALGAVGTTIGVFALPPLAFIIAVIGGTHISLGLVLGLGTAVLAITGAILWKRRSTQQAGVPNG
jgi:hypothetical protein